MAKNKTERLYRQHTDTTVEKQQWSQVRFRIRYGKTSVPARVNRTPNKATWPLHSIYLAIQ